MYMKILWLSNCLIREGDIKSTGTWLQSMAKALICIPQIELYNITIGSVPNVTSSDCDKIKQWIIPYTKLKEGLPPKGIIDAICSIIDTSNPDIVHIWGVERYWGLLSSRGYLKRDVLLEIQGLRYTCSDAFYGGMSLRDILLSINPIDLIFRNRRIDRIKNEHKKWGEFEKEILAFHKNISIQSEWVRASITPYCGSDVSLFKTKIAVRSEFMNSEKWDRDNLNSFQILVMSSSATPYKGIHILLKALDVVKKTHPKISLKIIGNYEQNKISILKSGYVRYLENQIKKLELQESVIFAGSLTAEQMVLEMQSSLLIVHPSFVESYSLALAESMAVGIPCVISYAGAMTELADDEISGLYYSPSDYRKCAYQIIRLIEDIDLSKSISKNAVVKALDRNELNSVVETQIGIYNKIIEKSHIL